MWIIDVSCTRKRCFFHFTVLFFQILCRCESIAAVLLCLQANCVFVIFSVSWLALYVKLLAQFYSYKTWESFCKFGFSLSVAFVRISASVKINKIVNGYKEYKVKQHYETKYSGCVHGTIDGDIRELQLKQMQEQLNSQHFMFQKVHSNNEKAVWHSFVIAQKIAQMMKPYPDGKFVKKCLIDVAQEMCPKMVT